MVVVLEDHEVKEIGDISLKREWRRVGWNGCGCFGC